MKPVYANIGSISSGTMRQEDLIPAFMSELDDLKERLSLSLDTGASAQDHAFVVEQVGAIDHLLAGIETRMSLPDYYGSPEAEYDLEDLFEALHDFAPPYVYFGSHPGDGADYGFWVQDDLLDDDEYDGAVLKLKAGDEWPELDAEVEYVLEVNDHGNCTLFNRNGTVIWSVV